MDFKKIILPVFLFLFVCAGDNVFADSQTLPGICEFTVPQNNATTTVDTVMAFEWDAATSGDAEIEEYQIQYFKNKAYMGTADYDISTTETKKEISFAVPGVYYLRVRAKDAAENYGQWSNGAGDLFKITVNETDDSGTILPIKDVLKKRAECMKGAWSGLFKNQGQCVAHYNQQIMAHIQNLIQTMTQKMQELRNRVKKQNEEAISHGYANWGQYIKAQKAKDKDK